MLQADVQGKIEGVKPGVVNLGKILVDKLRVTGWSRARNGCPHGRLR
jgi:hypothetical protein